ncbi:uncharacterized protein LOC119160112 [Rhipicephalus microplus]|uniref:uncharacterized protein LOC119160112 n=1 Tax=Rhipicephalus microplus TaxID=6941 RepID=UPI003F6B3134
MCYTFDWRGSNSLVNFKEDPLTYEMSMIVLWYPGRSPRLSQYEMDMTFHHVDSISAATKHTLLLRPSGSYEYSLQQRMLKRLEFPYDTNCVDYAKWEKLAHYPAYHTQETCFADCVRNETRRHCGCTLTDYPFRAFLNETFCASHEYHACTSLWRPSYEKVCSAHCRVPCHEVFYDANPVKREDPGLILEDGGYHMVSVKFSMSSTSVNVLMFIEKLQVTQILALVGGYLGIWLGLSIRTFAIILVDGCFERLRRLQRSKYAAAEVSSVARFVRLVVEVACLVLCVRNSLADVHHYWHFPAAVVYNEDTRVRFPVLTLCFPEGYNKSGMQVQQEIEAPLDIGGTGDATMQFNADHLKNLIEQAYPPQDMVLKCTMKARSDVCRDFECRKLWKAAYTYVLHTVCYSMDFDLAADLRETAFAECPEPWKYTLTMTVNAGRDPMGNQVIMATVHDSGSFSGGLPRTITMTATHKYVISAKQVNSHRSFL